jgi:hypothetical protein
MALGHEVNAHSLIEKYGDEIFEASYDCFTDSVIEICPTIAWDDSDGGSNSGASFRGVIVFSLAEL